VRVRAYLFGTILLAGGLPAAAPAEDACAPWPGELQPLPRVDDADPLHARWARMRADRLAQQALELEGKNGVEANRLWQRVLCFDPRSASARAGVERTRPRVVLRLPQPARRPATATAAARPAVPPPRRPAPPGPPPGPVAASKPVAAKDAGELARLDASLARVEEQLRTARFDEALSDLRALRGRIGEVGDSPPVRAQRVRFEVLSATAHVAYGDDGAARASLQRALAVDPGLDLDAAHTSPKLRRALEAARSEPPQ
jgi:hypothetical protein